MECAAVVQWKGGYLPSDVFSVERFVLQVGKVCSSVHAEGPIGGGLEVVQPHKRPLQLTLHLLTIDRKNNTVRINAEYTPLKKSWLICNKLVFS